MVDSDDTQKLALDLWPDVGKALGLGRNSTYEAARRGDIPTIRIGRRILVPRAALQRFLESAGQQEAELATQPAAGQR